MSCSEVYQTSLTFWSVTQSLLEVHQSTIKEITVTFIWAQQLKYIWCNNQEKANRPYKFLFVSTCVFHSFALHSIFSIRVIVIFCLGTDPFFSKIWPRNVPYLSLIFLESLMIYCKIFALSQLSLIFHNISFQGNAFLSLAP